MAQTMASFYKRQGSDKYWLKWRDASGKIRRESTGITHGSRAAQIAASNQAARKTVEETSSVSRRESDGSWDAWVPVFLATRDMSDETRKRYGYNWLRISTWLKSIGNQHPATLTRADCLGYKQWRMKQTPYHPNTMIMEIKLLNLLCHEASVRGFASANPAARLGFKREPAKEKHEITDHELTIIWGAIEKKLESKIESERRLYDFFRVSFIIGALQGCRISDTYADLDRDFNLRQMLFRVRTKGVKWIPLHPQVATLVAQLKKQGRRDTYEKPSQMTMISGRWLKFLRKIGFGHLSFHCFRVTASSKAERAGVPEPVCMRYLGHDNLSVHRTYRRVDSKEFTPITNLLVLPETASPASSTSSS